MDPRAAPGTGRRTAAQRAGDTAEDAVTASLASAGWRILARRLRIGRSEIDILAVDPGPPATLVVVEVRWRRSRAFGLPEETFDHRKREHLRRAIGRLLAAPTLRDGSRLPPLPLRVDLVVVEPPTIPGGPPRMRHHRSALEG